MDGGRGQQHAQGSSGRADLIPVPEVVGSGSDDEMKDATAPPVTLAPKKVQFEPEDSDDAMKDDTASSAVQEPNKKKQRM